VILHRGDESHATLPIEGRQFEGRFILRWEFLQAQPRRACSTSTRTAATSRPKGPGRDGDWRAATPGRIAWARRCAMIAGAWCNWRFFPRPPMDRAKDNPWPEMAQGFYKLGLWPRRRRRRNSAATRGFYLTTATEFVGDADGHSSRKVHTVEIEWGEERERGQFIPKECSGHGKSPPGATGAAGDGFYGAGTAVCSNKLGVERDGRSNAKADYGQIRDERQGSVCGW